MHNYTIELHSYMRMSQVPSHFLLSHDPPPKKNASGTDSDPEFITIIFLRYAVAICLFMLYAIMMSLLPPASVPRQLANYVLVCSVFW